MGLFAVSFLSLVTHFFVARLGVPFLTFLVALFVAGLSALLVGTRAAASISAEREADTWNTLLLLPSSTNWLLRSKLWGLLDMAFPYQIAYLLAAIPGALLSGGVGLLAVGLPWLGSWLLMYFTAAVGLECSARLGSSWRALVAALFQSGRYVLERTLTFGFLGGILLYGGFTVVHLDPAVGGGLGALLVASFLLLAQAEHQIEQCSLWIDQHERVAQGKERFRLPV
jgi:hypothetical protein